MSFTDFEKNNMLDAITATHVSLHTAVPPGNEVTGGSYAREIIAFDAAAGGTKDKTVAAVQFEVPAGNTVFFVGLFDALTVGNLLAFFPINGGDVDGVAAVLNAGDLFKSGGHTLADGDRVILKGPVGESLPNATPTLSETVIYFVVGVSGSDFQVSLTLGGAAVVIDADGQAYFQKVTPETFGAAGQLDLDSLTLKLEE